MEINPKFGIGERVISKYGDEDEYNQPGEVLEVNIQIKYKVRFGNLKTVFNVLEEDIKLVK